MVSQIKLGDIVVDVVLKDIKNVYLSVYPPSGQVRITAPEHMNLDTVRVFAVSKLAWIQKQQKKLRDQERETFREYLNRESHYVWGQRYLLGIVEADGPAGRGIDSREDVAEDSTWRKRRSQRGDGFQVVPRATEGGYPCPAREVGADHRRTRRTIFCAENENEVGKL